MMGNYYPFKYLLQHCFITSYTQTKIEIKHLEVHRICNSEYNIAAIINK